MNGITDPLVEEYVYNILSKSPSILAALEKTARRRHVPIVGPMIGRILYILAKTSKAKRVLEIGTAIGYSAIWLGLAVRNHKGKVITVEINKQVSEEAERNIRRANLHNVIQIVNGDGMEVIPKLKGKFDLIFMDDSKENYPRYLDLCVPRINSGGLLIADNALWKAEVARDSKSDEAAAIARFNQYLMRKMQAVIVPARDGLAIGIK